MPAAMLCKTSVCRSSRETCGTKGEHKTKYVCIVEADESMRIRMEGSLHRYHEDHIAEKGMNSMTHYSLVHKFIPTSQAMKIPDAKGAVETEWEKLEKLPAWQLTNVRNKNEVLAEARNEGRKVHFASLMFLCHLKTSELDPQFQKIQRSSRAYNDSGSYAVFIEQGSSASQMTAANGMDVISRLPGCAGQAADVFSANTQSKMEDAPVLLKSPKSECPDICIHLPKHEWPKSWSSMEDPVVPLERNLYGHPLAGLLWERQFENVLFKYDWEKISNWECLFVHREKGLFLWVFADDIKLAGKKQNIDPSVADTHERR